MKRLRVVFTTAWDRQQLAGRPDLVPDDCELCFEPPDDADCSDSFDVLGMIDRAADEWRGDTAGVFSSSDYPGATVAAAIGTALGLPATTPEAILRAAHKGESRKLQARVAPDATPPFAVLDPGAANGSDEHAAAEALAAAPLPAFVKPAKGCYSVLARRVADRDALRAFLRDPLVTDYRERYLRVYSALAERYLGPDVDSRAFVAEGVLTGRLVTCEAWVADGAPRAFGVVDSIRHATTGSFVAFEYPSSLPPAVQQRIERLTEQLGAAFGLRWTLFNVELMWDEARDTIGVIEINPRMCGQFADLYEKVDGVHGHAVALSLAIGRTPRVVRGAGACTVAASYPLRVFEPVRVVAAPDQQQLAAATAPHPGTLAWNEVHAGDELRDFAAGDDGASYRYGVVNVGASSREELLQRRDAIVAAAGWRFE